MSDLPHAVEDFLAQRTLAVAGVSRDGKLPANAIFKKLRDAGYDVYAVNPNAVEVEGGPCYPDFQSVPVALDGVVLAAPPEASADLVRQCVSVGVPRVWMHRSFGSGSVSQEAVALCREAGIAVIPGACPMMYLDPDMGHRCIRWILDRVGKLPSPEGFAG